MNLRIRTLCAAFGLLLGAATTLAAQQTLVLNNGDRLTGQLQGVAGGVWTFKHAGGDVKIPATNVASFTASDPIGVRLADGTIAAGTVAPAGNQLRVSLQDGTTRTVAPSAFAAVGSPTALDALVPVEIGFFRPFSQFWGAVVSLGFSDKSGNSRSRGLGANVEVARKSPKDRLTLRAGLAREDSRVGGGEDLQRIVEKYYGSLRADVFVSPKFFLFGETRQERDKFQDIDLRSIYNAGFGYQILSTPLTDLRAYASGGARREDFTSDLPTKTAAVLGIGAGLRRDLGLAVLGWNVDWGPNVEDFEDYRLRSDASLTTTIFQGLGFRLGVLNELNNKPSAGFKKHDMLVTTSLTYTIGG
jgi:putative salt-induced outer membrane protein YdiY